MNNLNHWNLSFCVQLSNGAISLLKAPIFYDFINLSSLRQKIDVFCKVVSSAELANIQIVMLYNIRIELIINPDEI